MYITRTPGLRLEPVGERWLAFSAISGETHALNDEAVAVLELLGDHWMQVGHLCGLLGDETGLEPAVILAALEPVWPTLEAAGLVCRRQDLPVA